MGCGRFLRYLERLVLQLFIKIGGFALGSTSTGIYYAWRVDFFGDVGSTGVLSSVTYSYGSPDTGNRLNPCVIMNHGVVAGYNFSIFVYDSYGRRSPDSFMYYNYTSFYVIEDGSMITYAVEYSYGIF